METCLVCREVFETLELVSCDNKCRVEVCKECKVQLSIHSDRCLICRKEPISSDMMRIARTIVMIFVMYASVVLEGSCAFLSSIKKDTSLLDKTVTLLLLIIHTIIQLLFVGIFMIPASVCLLAAILKEVVLCIR